MSNNSETDYKTILVSLLAGAAAGLTVGILMAPKSGDQIRADIGNSVDEYLSTAKRKAEELRTSATNIAQRGLREVHRTKDAAADKVNETVLSGAAGAHEAIDTGAQKGHRAVDTAADALSSGTRG